MTWTNAQKYCREKFTDLATVRSDAENQAMHAVALSAYPWFGLHIDPNSYWSDGSISSFRHWEGASLPVGSMSVVCGVAALQNSGKWKFLQCETRLPFVCYSVPPPPGEQFLDGGITTFTQVTDQNLPWHTFIQPRQMQSNRKKIAFLCLFVLLCVLPKGNMWIGGMRNNVVGVWPWTKFMQV